MSSFLARRCVDGSIGRGFACGVRRHSPFLPSALLDAEALCFLRSASVVASGLEKSPPHLLARYAARPIRPDWSSSSAHAPPPQAFTEHESGVGRSLSRVVTHWACSAVGALLLAAFRRAAIPAVISSRVPNFMSPLTLLLSSLCMRRISGLALPRGCLERNHPWPAYLCCLFLLLGGGRPCARFRAPFSPPRLFSLNMERDPAAAQLYVKGPLP